MFNHILGVIFFITFSQYFKIYADSKKKNEIKIAFGSCNKQDRKQVLWSSVIKEKPDVWVWLGDNIYADSYKSSIIRDKYIKQNQR